MVYTLPESMADMLAMVVDHAAWHQLLNSPVSQIHENFSSQSARAERVKKADFLSRRYDVDVEAEILDWLESQIFPCEPAVSIIGAASQKLKDGAEIEELASGLWLLAEWVSHGTWRCMEGRGFLYIEPYAGGSFSSVDDLYLKSTWLQFNESLKSLCEDEYSESVVLDWMGRREKLGETMNASEDGRILSTMQSHQKLSTSLHKMMNQFASDPRTALFARREWSSFLGAGFGGLNIGALLAVGEVGGNG